MIAQVLQRPTAMGLDPRVDLMPPLLASRVKARGVLRWLILLIVLVLLLVVLATVLASGRQSAAESELAAAQQDTARILAERAGYADVSTAGAAVDVLDDAVAFGSSTEILWADVYEDLDGRLPAGASIDQITFTGRAPWEAGAVPENVFRLPREASIDVTVTTLAVPDVVTLIDGISDMRGFADATPTTVASADGVYRTDIRLNLSADALSARSGGAGVPR